MAFRKENGWLQSLRRRHRGYSGARPDVVRLVEFPPRRVLDVGCGAGITGTLLRQRFPGVYLRGVEQCRDLAQLAAENGTDVIVGGIDTPVVQEELIGESFDLIICADVLEHLEDPWAVMRFLRGVLSPDGVLITSIPNVRHLSTFWSLAVVGTWPRRKRGIHDETHLRFFTRKDILQLGRSAGYEPALERRNLRLIEAAAWTQPAARLLDFWPFRPFLTFQYLHCWRSAASGD